MLTVIKQRRGWQFYMYLSAKTAHWCIVCATQFKCCSAKFATSFLLNYGLHVTVQSWIARL